ncbi:MAG: hypothetical protein HQ528_04800, partial [Candidatus Marinimicrobia bacterium]|nr:hypothetical protein [Candidatus Neomarinimicrobiota bacterium]
MKRFIALSLFLFSLFGTMLFADDAKVLPPNVFRVRMVPLIVNTDQYFRSNGEIGPYIWENLGYGDLVDAYVNFHGNLSATNLVLGDFTEFLSYITKDGGTPTANVSANEAISYWNSTYGLNIPAFSTDAMFSKAKSNPWGNIKNTATLDATGSFVFAMEYGITDKLALGMIVPYKNAKITHDWSWVDNDEDDAGINDMYGDYAATLGAINAAKSSGTINYMDSLAMEELFGKVAWAAFVSGDDPFGNGIPASLFPFYADQNPDDIDGYADIYELASFYYPTMTGKGFGDIE